MDTLQQDPDFANRLGVDEKNIKSLRALGPKEGSQVLDTLVKAKASGKYPGGVHGPVKKNGQWVYEGIGANGEVTDIPAGEPASTANIELKGAEGKPSKPPSPSMLSSLATKAYNDAMVTTPGYFGTHYGASTEDRKASAMAEFAEQLTSTGMDPDQAQELAEKYVAPKFESPKSRLAAKPKTAEKPAEKAPMGKAIGTTSKPDGDYNLKGRHIRVIGGKAYDIGKAE